MWSDSHGTGLAWAGRDVSVLGFRIVVAILFACALTGCRRGSDAGSEGGLLLHRAPIESKGVERAELVTDGVAAREGDGWKSHRTALFTSTDAALVYDLGRSVPVHAAWLQGDNND